MHPNCLRKLANKCLFFFLLGPLFFTSYGQGQVPTVRPSDSLNSPAFLNTVQQSLNYFYADYANAIYSDSILKALHYEATTVPVFSNDIYCERLQAMSNQSPFQFDCNPITLSSVKFFAENRRSFAKIVLGRSALYFDLFEEKLAEYGLPLELKYLAVIESGLRPQIKSKAGALGLWQFMYRTGLYYGLEENSYIDERMDPIKATDAACRFLKKLYGIYGDWNLALAAYNAGPGTINKAIQRSGNQKSYWAIRSSLPTETQGYVPTFIAAAYLLTYHAEHNLMPAAAKIHNAQLDTMCLKRGLSMKTISMGLDWEIEEIKTLNPIYKTEYIPASIKNRCVTGPLEKITLLVGMEDSLYALEHPSLTLPPIETNVLEDSLANEPLHPDSLSLQYIYHKVKSGETLKSISTKYSITTEEIMEWNALQTSNIYVGQRLTLKKTHTVKAEVVAVVKPVVKPKKYYVVKAGDTLSQIAARQHVSLAQLKKLNPAAARGVIHPGDRLRIK
jgi:membrane-bound lytic murein transglycosylase D